MKSEYARGGAGGSARLSKSPEMTAYRKAFPNALPLAPKTKDNLVFKVLLTHLNEIAYPEGSVAEYEGKESDPYTTGFQFVSKVLRNAPTGTVN